MTKTNPDAIHVAITSGAVDLTALNLPADHPLAGMPDYSFSEGARLKGSHPVVAGWPQFFIEDGADDHEIHAARNAIGAGRPNDDVFA